MKVKQERTTCFKVDTVIENESASSFLNSSGVVRIHYLGLNQVPDTVGDPNLNAGCITYIGLIIGVTL